MVRVNVAWGFSPVEVFPVGLSLAKIANVRHNGSA